MGAVGRKSGLTLMMEEGTGLPETLLALARDFAVRLIPRQPETLTVADRRLLAFNESPAFLCTRIIVHLWCLTEKSV